MIDITDFSLYNSATSHVFADSWTPPLSAAQEWYWNPVGGGDSIYFPYYIYDPGTKIYHPGVYMHGGETPIACLNNGGVMPSLAEDAATLNRWSNGGMKLYDTAGNIASLVGAPILGLEIEFSSLVDDFSPQFYAYSDDEESDSATEYDIEESTLIDLYGDDVYKKKLIFNFAAPRTQINSIEVFGCLVVYTIKAITDTATLFWTNKSKLTETA